MVTEELRQIRIEVYEGLKEGNAGWSRIIAAEKRGVIEERRSGDCEQETAWRKAIPLWEKELVKVKEQLDAWETVIMKV